MILPKIDLGPEQLVRCALSVRCCCLDRSNFGEPLECELVGSARGPSRRRLPMRRMLGRQRRACRRRDRRRCVATPGRGRGRRRATSSQSISATRSAVMRMLRGLGSPWTTHRSRPVSRAHAARQRTTPSGGIAPRSTFVPVSACRRSVDDRQPGRWAQPCVSRCSWRSVSATRRQSASVSGGSPST